MALIDIGKNDYTEYEDDLLDKLKGTSSRSVPLPDTEEEDWRRRMEDMSGLVMGMGRPLSAGVRPRPQWLDQKNASSYFLRRGSPQLDPKQEAARRAYDTNKDLYNQLSGEVGGDAWDTNWGDLVRKVFESMRMGN